MDFSKYFANKVIATEMNKGYTNDNYLTDNGYVVKVYSNLIINNEYNTLKYIKDFDVPVYYCDKEIKVTKYIEGKTFEDQDYDVDLVKKVAIKLKELHDKKIIASHSFSPFEHLKEYLAKIKIPFYEYQKYFKYIDEAKKIYKESEKIFCHNDLSSGNLLFTKNKLYIIDWEYSGNNDPLFDVTSFLNENNLYFTKYKEIFFNEYFGNENIPIKKLDTWNNFQNLMWCVWANMMYDAKGDKAYKKFAKTKKENLDEGSSI